MGTLKINHLDNKKLTPIEHVDAIEKSVMDTLGHSELGVYRNVTLDIDDLWRLLGHIQQLQSDVDFLMQRKSFNDEMIHELTALEDEKVKEILMKPRVVRK